MIALTCRDRHGVTRGLCSECGELLTYARKRLEKCPFAEKKPTCAKCPIHCYQPNKREQIQAVMRYAGPRMMHRHPVLALRHWLDGMKEVPALPARRVKLPGEEDSSLSDQR